MFLIQLDNCWECDSEVEFEICKDLRSGEILGRLHYPYEFEQTMNFSALRQHIDIVHVKPYFETKAIRFRACVSVLKFLFARYPNRLAERNRKTQTYLDQLCDLDN